MVLAGGALELQLATAARVHAKESHDSIECIVFKLIETVATAVSWSDPLLVMHCRYLPH